MDIISIADAAERLGVCQATVYRWVQRADRPAFFVRVGRRWKVSVPRLDEYIGKQG